MQSNANRNDGEYRIRRRSDCPEEEEAQKAECGSAGTHPSGTDQALGRGEAARQARGNCCRCCATEGEEESHEDRRLKVREELSNG
jgi:hypothetical protein